MAVVLDFGGRYTHFDPKLAKKDAGPGLMSMHLTLTPSAKTVSGAGEDSTGPFVVRGFYDGKNLRFAKRYRARASEQGSAGGGHRRWFSRKHKAEGGGHWWKYVGEHIDGQQWRFQGGWGNGTKQLGNFAIAARNVPPLGVEGVWKGLIFYGEDTETREPPTIMSVRQLHRARITGGGHDASGMYIIEGAHFPDDGPGRGRVEFSKLYTGAGAGTRWEYAGTLTHAGWKTRMQGTWGDDIDRRAGGGGGGTFCLERLHPGGPDELAALLPTRADVRGRLGVGVGVGVGVDVVWGDKKAFAREMGKALMDGHGVVDGAFEDGMEDALQGLFEGFVSALTP